MSGNKPREINIKLICPSLSKVTQVVAWDDQRIDLGFVARAFGLDPSSLRLNSHFIGRGVDLVASSVTWKSLLSFFSSKGLPTGKDQRDALVVTGKLCKVGLKPIGVVGRECLFHMRIGGHDSQHFQNGVGKMLEGENAGNSRDIHDKVDDLSGSIARSQFTCSYASKNLKRIREDETTAANYKRIR
ncbi:hypothetical protein glysoja_047129 [Glycine soja]|uniref:Uncharacterized protein n=1 Tax=Glycine soja TaxID=3848 RepID=A0A0B2RPI9_GLYSO|nr:hypothetical protein glysoja_047129 [Glycine soja]